MNIVEVNVVMEEEKVLHIITDCKNGAKTLEEIPDIFDGSDICMECPHIAYKNGTLSCDYAKV